MDSMKSLLKSRSSHELLNQKSSPISSFGDSATTIHPSANTTLCTATSQLLQVPNVHSNSSSLINSSVSESSELSQVSDCDANDPHSKDSARKLKKLQKSIRKQRKRNEKQLAELVQFLHVEPPSPASASSSKLDELDQKCPSSRLNKSLQEYLHPDKENTSGSNKRKITVCKSLDVHNRTNITSNQKPPSIVPTIVAPRFQIGDDADPDDVDEDYAEANERTLTNNDTITAAGFRRIRRFGYDVADGCGFPLSMKREEQADADEHTLTLTRQKSWKDIIARADQYLHKQSITPQKIAVQQLYQVCPCPEIQCNSLSGVLPFRRWNSECRLSIRSTLERSESFASASSGSKDVLTSACNWTAFQQTTRRHSCEDLRHLSGCSLRNTQNYLQNHMPSISRQQSFGPMSDVSVCCSSELSSERSTSCSLRSMSSSCSSISGVSTLIALDLNQLDLNPFEVFNQHFDPRLVAVEMTKIEQDLFLQLNPTELSRQLFTSSRSINLSQFFEMHCIYFFVQLILNESQLSSRVQCLLLCIELLDELYTLRNWQSLNSLLIALHCIPIVRLYRSWIALRSLHPQAYERFCTLSNSLHMQTQAEPHLLHTHNQASIPCLSELMDEMRARVAFKLNRLDNGHQRPTVFGKPETLTDWLTSEVRDLETRLFENQRWQEAEEEARGKNRKRSGLIKKIVKSFMKRRKRENGPSADKLRTEALDIRNNLSVSEQFSQSNHTSNHDLNGLDPDQTSASIAVNSSGIGTLSSAHASSATIELLHTDEDVVDDELIMMKTANSNQRLEEWREIQMDLKLKLNKLKPEAENMLLNEISKCLRFHQQLACNYSFPSSPKAANNVELQEPDRTRLVIRKCFVAITNLKVNSMQQNMQRSIQIEPPASIQPSFTRVSK